jgi:hypothetical protein
MLPSHEKELIHYISLGSTEIGALTYANAILSDVIDGDMSGEELQEHILDVKEILVKVCFALDKKR